MWKFLFGRDKPWEPVCVLVPRRSINTGEKISADIMRRKVNGSWQYREATEEEEEEAFMNRQW